MRHGGESNNLARMITAAGLAIWFCITMMGASKSANFSGAVLPLLGFYPKNFLFPDHPGYSERAMFAWGITTAAVFLLLAALGIFCKSKAAAISFLILLILSALSTLFRIADALA
jgi:hypothetical protein